MWTTNVRAGLNRGVLMGRFTQIMGGSSVADPDRHRRGCKLRAWPVNAVS